MFRTDFKSDPFEAQAIQRRQKLEHERKQRIFDPKVRCHGIDIQSLDAQILEKQKMTAQVEERNHRYDAKMMLAGNALDALDQRKQHSRRHHAQLLNQYRQTHQKPEDRLEFDLNNPRQLEQERSVRTGSHDPLCSVSGAQILDGEDLNVGERRRHQMLQMKIWTKESSLIKEAQRMTEALNARTEMKRQEELAEKQRSMMHSIEASRRHHQREIMEFNKNLAAEKQIKDKNERTTEAELVTVVVPAMLQGPKPAGSDCWRLSSDGERQTILDEQAKAAEEIELRKSRKREEEMKWTEEERRHLQVLDLLQSHRDSRTKQTQLLYASENIKKSAEDKARQNTINKSTYANKVTEDYFKQFNTSSR